MCLTNVYLDGEEIMRDVMVVEPLPAGVRLEKLFEPPKIVPAIIRKIDLLNHQVILESIQEAKNEPGEKAAGVDPPLDQT